MRWRSVLLLFVLFPLSTAFGLIERTVEKIFPVGPGAQLKLETYHGPVRVDPADVTEIHVLVREAFEVKSDPAADRLLKDLDLELKQEGNAVDVTARYRRLLRWTWETWPPVTLAFEITVPRDCRLDLLSREGNLTITGPRKGDVHAKALAGTIFVGETEGAITASSAQGDVSVTACTGALDLSTRSGNILVGRAGGTTHLDGAGGSLEIQRARGRVEARTDGADLKIGFAPPITESSELKTSGGDVIVNFDPRSACEIDARASSFASVKVRELPLTVTSGEAGTSHLAGTLNGGGPKVTINASGGSVRLIGVPAAQ